MLVWNRAALVYVLCIVRSIYIQNINWTYLLWMHCALHISWLLRYLPIYFYGILYEYNLKTVPKLCTTTWVEYLCRKYLHLQNLIFRPTKRQTTSCHTHISPQNPLPSGVMFPIYSQSELQKIRSKFPIERYWLSKYQIQIKWVHSYMNHITNSRISRILSDEVIFSPKFNF